MIPIRPLMPSPITTPTRHQAIAVPLTRRIHPTRRHPDTTATIPRQHAHTTRIPPARRAR
jgi:hypothetical protein